jgi:hypothetical protein
MADQPKPQNHEMWSAISPSHLGLKAGFWTGKDGDALKFRSIVGWVTVLSRDVPSEAPPRNSSFAVVIGDNMFPVLAVFLPDYFAVFDKDLSEDEAKAAAASWRKSGSSVEPQPNVKGTGLA